MHQLQILSQQADHQAPSASSTQSTAMLASLLASNPALLQAMQLPPSVVDAGVGAISAGGPPHQKPETGGPDAAQPPPAVNAGNDISSAAAAPNTAGNAAASLQLGSAPGGLQTTTLVTKPRAAVAAGVGLHQVCMACLVLITGSSITCRHVPWSPWRPAI